MDAARRLPVTRSDRWATAWSRLAAARRERWAVSRRLAAARRERWAVSRRLAAARRDQRATKFVPRGCRVDGSGGDTAGDG
jgi:hypothetical protein